VTLRLSATVAERDLEASLTVGPGETVALLGPNGSGKSTLLAVAAGLLRPDAGRVELSGRPLTDVPTGSFVPPHRRRIALLAQEPLLFPHLTVLDNVAFGPRSAGASRAESRARATHWLDEVGVADLADRKPGQLSGGQAQRVAVARALAAEPELLLLDEPMAALDVAVTPALRQVLKRVLAGRSAVIATHDVLDALLLADRVVVVDGGRIVEEGPTADVLSRPRSAFAARLAGLNLLAGVWRDGSVETPSGLTVQGHVVDGEPAEGDPAVAVFRPAAASVFLAVPGGSPRNAFEGVITDLEPRGDQIRVRAGGLSADITPRSVTELDLAPGTPVVLVVKAAEVSVYPI